MQAVIVGIDLSLMSTGLCVLREQPYVDCRQAPPQIEVHRLQAHGNTEREKLGSLYSHLWEAFNHLQRIDAIVIEDVLYTKFKQTSRKMIMAHGVLKAVMGRQGIITPLLYVHPTTLKRLVLGYAGRGSTKTDIIGVMNKLITAELQHDQADATALAYIGLGVGVGNLTMAEQKYSQIRCDVIEDQVFKQFGLSLAGVAAERKERARDSRRKYRTREAL